MKRDNSLSQSPEVQNVPVQLKSYPLRDQNQKLQKRDVLHAERVEDESGPGHCLTIQWLRANGTSYASLGCTVQHVLIRGWEGPPIQEQAKSHLEKAAHIEVWTGKRHWKSWEKATVRTWRTFCSDSVPSSSLQNTMREVSSTFSKYTWDIKAKKGGEECDQVGLTHWSWFNSGCW